jgi:hypothetical protein
MVWVVSRFRLKVEISFTRSHKSINNDWTHERDLLAGGDLTTIVSQPAHQFIQYLVLCLLITERREKKIIFRSVPLFPSFIYILPLHFFQFLIDWLYSSLVVSFLTYFFLFILSCQIYSTHIFRTINDLNLSSLYSLFRCVGVRMLHLCERQLVLPMPDL